MAADFMLDGNALAGPLGEIFLHEMTMAEILCAGCGSMEPIGAEHAYVHAPSVVMRCCHCGEVLLVMTRSRERSIVSFPGTARLEIHAG